MDVERRDGFLDRGARGHALHTGPPPAVSAKAGFAEPQRLLAIVGDEHRARCQDARLAPLRQCFEVGVYHRILNLVQRQSSWPQRAGLVA